MALPGGGIVSVPLETTSLPGSIGGGRGGGNDRDRVASPCSSTGSTSGHQHTQSQSQHHHHQQQQQQLLQGLPPPPVPALPPPPSTADGSSGGGGGGGGSGSDLLTVPAGEPVTHFNLDQLLEIVQSFQLDATLAGNEDASPHMSLATAEGAAASIIKVSAEL